MTLLISTTGTEPIVTLQDLGNVSFTHPVVDLDIQEPVGAFSEQEIKDLKSELRKLERENVLSKKLKENQYYWRVANDM